MKTLAMIVNPRAGKGLALKSLGSMVEAMRPYGYAPTVYFTERAGQAKEFAEMYGAGQERIVCVGGDGTLSEVFSGIMNLDEDKRPAVGYIPMGTANDIASTMELSSSPEKAAAIAAGGEAKPLDLGKLGDSYFSYISAFGAFTDVPYATPQNTKNMLGHLAYMIEGVTRLPKIKPYTVKMEYDGGVEEGEFLFGCIMNTLSVGGVLKFSPENVSLADGLFEIILIRDPKSIIELSGVVASLLSGNLDNPHIFFAHSRKAHFVLSEPAAWTVDGEDGGEHAELYAENVHKAVRMIVPKKEI